MINANFDFLMNQYNVLSGQTLDHREANNLIYSLIKFGFKKIQTSLNSPPNMVINKILMEVIDNPTVDNIIGTTLTTILKDYNIYLRDAQIIGLREHMKFISALFMNEPYELRIDLGDDTDSDVFIIKN